MKIHNMFIVLNTNRFISLESTLKNEESFLSFTKLRVYKLIPILKLGDVLVCNRVWFIIVDCQCVYWL